MKSLFKMLSSGTFFSVLLAVLLYLGFSAQTFGQFLVNANDDYVTASGSILVIDVLANDTGSGLIITNIGCGPAYGEADITPSGAIIYSYNTGAMVDDQFCYTVCTGGTTLCDTAMVYISAGSGSTAPIANDDYVQIYADSLGAITATIAPLLNDVTFGSSVTVALALPPANGTALLMGSVFVYTPNPGFTGADQFTYTICNSMGECSTATIYIWIEDGGSSGSAPIANNDNYCTTQDTPLIINVLENDVWDPALSIDYTIITEPSNGTLTPGAVAFYYMPNPGFTGTDQFTYQLCTGNTPAMCDMATVTICVLPDTITTVCTGMACVWPGDANNNGVANNFDILALGLAYGYTGGARPDASLNWVGQYAPNWDMYISTADSTAGTTLGYFNAKYADCDGNGIVEAADTLAVSLNYGLTHGKTGDQPDEDAPVIGFTLPTTVQENTWVTADIILGSPDTPVTNVHGLAFTFEFDTNLIQPSSVSFNFNAASWLGSAQNLSFNKALAGGIADVAYTRTDKTNVSGYGVIGTVSFFVIDNIDGKNQSAPQLEIKASNASVVNASGVLTTLNTSAASTEVSTSITTSGGNAGNMVKVYPNPTAGMLYISSPLAVVETATLYNTAGQAVLTQHAQTNNLTVNTDSLAPGLYLLQLVSANGISTHKVQVWR